MALRGPIEVLRKRDVLGGLVERTRPNFLKFLGSRILKLRDIRLPPSPKRNSIRSERRGFSCMYATGGKSVRRCGVQ